MNSGFSEEVINQLLRVFSHYSTVRRVVLFGSRGRGEHHTESDIDIAIFTDSGVSGELYADIDDAVGIYKVDIIDMCTLYNGKLQQHILADGIELYHESKNRYLTHE